MENNFGFQIFHRALTLLTVRDRTGIQLCRYFSLTQTMQALGEKKIETSAKQLTYSIYKYIKRVR